MIFVFLLGNAAGRQTPPLIIFQGKRLPNQFKQMLPKGWNTDCSESGWMNSDTFYNYISHTFYPWLSTVGISIPIILFVDGHVSHRSLKLSEFCLEKQIILVSFLPNMTHISQPMDVVVYGPLKRKWAACLKHFRNSNQNLERMSKPMFCDLLNKCVNESLTTDLLRTSFEKTALWPFDADAFNYSKLSVSSEKTVEQDQSLTANSIFETNQIKSKFLDRLERLIESTFPGRLHEFKRSNDQWLGDEFANDLFIIWKESGGEIINPNSNEEVESFELVEVFDPVDETGRFVEFKLVSNVNFVG